MDAAPAPAAAPAPEENPCLSCGLCCSHFRISFYHGEVDDMPCGFVPAEMVEQLTPFRACMKGTNQVDRRCVALVGTPGAQTFCSIYERRPTPCREFEIWDALGVPNERCQQLRAAHGLSPLLPHVPVVAEVPVAVEAPLVR
ncbi:MAG: YkgJ family cysteine cluster protein [Sideroxydans sp.]|nr:YkgJ family cysteine cluster protein [Sideroxydans sp.]